MTRLMFAALMTALVLGWMGCASRPHAVISGEDSARLQRAKDADARKLIQLEAHEAALVEQARKHAEELAEIERQMVLEKRRATHETEMERAKLEKRKLELQGEIAEAEAEAERIRVLREAMTGEEPTHEGQDWDGRSGYNVEPGDTYHWIWDDEEQAHHARALLLVAAAPDQAQEPSDDTSGGLSFASAIAGFLLISVLVALKYHYGRGDASAGLSHRGDLFRSDTLPLNLESRDTTLFPVAARLLCHYQPVSVGGQGRNSRISELIDRRRHNGQERAKGLNLANLSHRKPESAFTEGESRARA